MANGKPTPGLDDRCKCGWGVGENLSGDCGDCNAAIAKLPKSNRRSRQPAQQIKEREFDEVDSDDVDAVPGFVQAAEEEDNVFEKDKRVREEQKAKEKAYAEARKAAKEAADLREKQDADALLERSGFTRGFVEENGRRQANLLHTDWLLIHIPRDGHCLMHCCVQILQMRQPGHAIKNNLQMRAALAQYFEDHDNKLEIVDVGRGGGIFQCENIECLRRGKDASGDMNYYGGLAECVAFSYRFAISLQVFAPETISEGVFHCPGGGPSDRHAPEVMMLSLGWRVQFGKVSRSRGKDHWVRMINVHTSVAALDSIAVTQNCIVTTEDGNDHEAKVVRALQARIPRYGDLVYAYDLQTPYGRPLGHFLPSQLRRPEVVVIEGDDNSGDAPEATAGDDSDKASDNNDGDSSSDSDSDENNCHGGSDDNDGQGGDQGNADKCKGGPAQQAVYRGPGRKPKSENDADATNWCHDTELTGLEKRG
jgi:hypothetical protein